MARGNQVYWFNQNGIDQYVSVNTFSVFKRRETKVFELKSFYLDIDFKLVGINPSKYINNMKFVYDYADKVVGRCYELSIPIPTQINFSGNGLHVYWEIRNINERGDDGKKLYHANGQECGKVYKIITNRLIELFEDLGADPNAKGISRVLRIEKTINSKNNLECRKVFLSREITTIKEMAVILDYTLDEVKEFYNQPATDNKKLLLTKPIPFSSSSSFDLVISIALPLLTNLSITLLFLQLCNLKPKQKSPYEILFSITICGYAFSSSLSLLI